MKKKTSLTWEKIRNLLLVLLPVLILLALARNAAIAHRARREILDRDTTPPQIFLTRDHRYFVGPGEQYEEEGYAAYDDRDGDITKKVEVSISKDMVQYKVRDEAGNITIRCRRIPYAGQEEERASLPEEDTAASQKGETADSQKEETAAPQQ